MVPVETSLSNGFLTWSMAVALDSGGEDAKGMATGSILKMNVEVHVSNLKEEVIYSNINQSLDDKI